MGRRGTETPHGMPSNNVPRLNDFGQVLEPLRNTGDLKMPRWANVGPSTSASTSAQSTAHQTSQSIQGQGLTKPENTQRNANHSSTWGPSVLGDQLSKNEGPAVAPYLSAEREIHVPEGQSLHVCYKCKVFFLSPKCSVPVIAGYIRWHPLLCYCVDQHTANSTLLCRRVRDLPK
uniref:Uncharacterized protein n=1 Tax=Lygus hesperus TaxID=30085 RepID=A0A0A9WRF6_LYGHE